MRLLITGGCGFIGTNFIRHILGKYPAYSIINLDKLTYAGNRDNLRDLEPDKRYEFIRGDICDAELVGSLVKRSDAVVHFAAESHVDRSIHSSAEFIRTNILGTHILLEAALHAGKRRFHHISTDEVFGSLGKTGFFSEETAYDPRSPYSASKAASDHLVRAYLHTHGLPITITNCSNNYGPYQYPEKLIPLFITNLMEEKKVPVYGDGKNIRDWLHVQDHCEAVDLVLHKGKAGETYCIGGNCEKTNLEITRALIKAFGMDDGMIAWVQDRLGHDRRYAIDASKIRKELGWAPRYSFEQGLKETVAWYKENVQWWQKLKNRDFEEFEKKKQSR